MSNVAEAVTCPDCKRAYKWKPELAGKRVKCKCGQRIQFPHENPALDQITELDVVEDPAHIPAPESDQWDGMDLAGAAAGEQQAAGMEAPKLDTVMKICPTCSTPVTADQVICTRCGTNVRSGKKIATTVQGPPGRTAEVAATAGRVILSLVLGGITAVACAIIWIVIIFVTGYELGLVAWGIGLATGGVIRLVNRNGGVLAAMAGAGFALLSLLLVKGVLVAIALAADIPVSEAFSFWDILWTFLAVSSAYKLAQGAD